MKKTINVTERDIKFGVLGDAEHCPVARAIKRVLKSEYYTKVGPSTIVILRIRTLARIALEMVVKYFIYDFDEGHTVKPFKFQLEIPKRFLKDN